MIIFLKRVAMLLITLIVGFVLYLYWQNSQAPQLGVMDGQLKPLSSEPNCVSTQTDMEEKRVEPLAMKENLALTMAAIKAAIENYGYGTADIELESSGYLYASFTTPTMKWIDDVEFWVDEESKIVHFRSSSRAGYSDRGLNRQRYDALKKTYASL